MGVYLEDLTYKEILPILARTGKLIDTRKIIEIDHTNTELLEFFNEFKKWKASKEVAKYINAVYGERRE